MDNTNTLMHIGMPGRSGRYPLGSGKNPYQHNSGNHSSSITSLTKAIKTASNNHTTRRTKKSIAKVYKKTKANVQKQKDDASNKKSVQEQKQEILKSRSAKELYKHADLFDDNELQKAYKRLQTEQNIKNLIPKEVSRGQKFVEKSKIMRDSINNISGIIENGASAYKKASKLWNAILSESDSPNNNSKNSASTESSKIPDRDKIKVRTEWSDDGEQRTYYSKSYDTTEQELAEEKRKRKERIKDVPIYYV